MGSSREIVKRDDCPACGKNEGAYMGGGTWGHSILCCSDACGAEIKKRLVKNENSKKYQKKLTKMYRLQDELEKLRHKGIGTIEPFFEF